MPSTQLNQAKRFSEDQVSDCLCNVDSQSHNPKVKEEISLSCSIRSWAEKMKEDLVKLVRSASGVDQLEQVGIMIADSQTPV